jgi:hypothetical protein
VTTTLTPWPKPTTTDVAAVLRARTKDLVGDELGDFTADTRPTGTEVDQLIGLAYDEVVGYVGVYLGDRCAGLARSLVVIRTAWWIEGSYFPEQVRSDRTVRDDFAGQWAAGLEALVACVEGNLPGAVDGDGTATVAVGLGMINVHGWTSVRPPFGIPDPPP